MTAGAITERDPMAVIIGTGYPSDGVPIVWSKACARFAASHAASQINDIQDIEEQQHGL